MGTKGITIPAKARPILRQIKKAKEEVDRLREEMLSGDFANFNKVQEKWAAAKVKLANLEESYDSCFAGELLVSGKHIKRKIPDLDMLDDNNNYSLKEAL